MPLGYSIFHKRRAGPRCGEKAMSLTADTQSAAVVSHAQEQIASVKMGSATVVGGARPDGPFLAGRDGTPQPRLAGLSKQRRGAVKVGRTRLQCGACPLFPGALVHD